MNLFGVRSAPSKPAGANPAIQKRFQAPIAIRKPAPVSLGTGGGQPAIYAPPTVAPPPSATQAVSQQLETSDQLNENTITGQGIGAGKSSTPVTVKVKTSTYYAAIALMGVVLVLAFAWDRGKL
jgi:hypothetical protein